MRRFLIVESYTNMNVGTKELVEYVKGRLRDTVSLKERYDDFFMLLGHFIDWILQSKPGSIYEMDQVIKELPYGKVKIVELEPTEEGE